jgi:hypothetical protein
MITKNAINNGLFMGVVFIVSSYALYSADSQSFINLKSSILFIPFLLLLFKTGTDARRINDGYISYGAVFKDLLFASIIGTFLCTSFEYILFNFIDPSLKVVMKDIALKGMEEMEGMMNSDLYVKVLERFDTENLYSLSFSISQFVIRMFVPCALFSAAMAMIIKREPINLQNKNT